jgi:hypothetical protein
MFSLNNVRPPLLNKKLSLYLCDIRNDTFKKYMKNNKDNFSIQEESITLNSNSEPPSNNIFLFISLVSFMVGYYVGKYKMINY